MASFTAFLCVLNHRIRLRQSRTGFWQDIHWRSGFPRSKVGNDLIVVELDAGELTDQLHEALLAWAASNTKTEDGFIDYQRTDQAGTDHHWWWKRGYCIGYHFLFDSRGLDGQPSVRIWAVISPGEQGYERGTGAPFMLPVGKEYEYKPAKPALVAAAQAVRGAVPNPDIPPHLPAPRPQPSPDHQQVHLTAQEWKDLIKGRWDRSASAKRKKFKFLQQHRQTEFHVDGDPFTYRTDADGKIVSVYDAHKCYNVTGTRKGYAGIPLTLNSEPTFVGTPHMYPVTGNQKNVVVIDMAGHRSGDFRAANAAAGLTDVVKAQGLSPDDAPIGYTWHHRDDFQANPNPPPYGTCTMELVNERAHEKTFVHFGACDQCNKHNNRKIYT